MNRRMRTRMSGGVRGGRQPRPPTRLRLCFLLWLICWETGFRDDPVSQLCVNTSSYGELLEINGKSIRCGPLTILIREAVAE